MAITYHLVAADVWTGMDPDRPYLPASLEVEGFVHCTDGAEELLRTANRHLRDDPRPYLVLSLDLDRIGAPWRYDEPDTPYPHVYGPIDRSAVVAVQPIERAPDGRFTGFRC